MVGSSLLLIAWSGHFSQIWSHILHVRVDRGALGGGDSVSGRCWRLIEFSPFLAHAV